MRSNPIDMVLICTLCLLCRVQGTGLTVESGQTVDTSPNVEHIAGPGLSQAGSPIYSLADDRTLTSMQEGVTTSAVDSSSISYPEAACSTCNDNTYFICKNHPFSSTDRLFATDANGYPTNVPVSSFHWKRSGDDLMCNSHHTNNFLINDWGCTFKVQKHHNPGSFTITITGYFRLGMDQLEYDSGVNGYPSNIENCIPSNPATTYSGVHGDTIVEADPHGHRFCQYGSANWYRTRTQGFPNAANTETILTSSWESRQSWYINDYLFSSDAIGFYAYTYRAERLTQNIATPGVPEAYTMVTDNRIPRCDTSNTIMIRNQFLVGCAGSYQGFCVPCGRMFPDIPDKSVPVSKAVVTCQSTYGIVQASFNANPVEPECICPDGKYLKDCGINRFFPPTHKFEYCVGENCPSYFQDYSTTSTSITNAGHCADCVSCPEGWYIPAEWGKCNQQGNGDIYRHPIYGLNNINGPNMCKSCLTNGIATCAVNEYHTCGMDSTGMDAGQCQSCGYCPSGQYAAGCGIHDGVGSLPEDITYLNSNNENMYAWDVVLQDIKGSRDWPTAHSAKGTCTACASCSTGTRVGCSGNSPGMCRTDDSSDATYQVTGGTRNCMTTTSVITSSLSITTPYFDVGGGSWHPNDGYYYDTAYGTPVSDGCDTLNAQVHPDWTGYYETEEPCMAFDAHCTHLWQFYGQILFWRVTPHTTEGQDCVCGSNQYWGGCYSDGTDPGQCKDCDDCPTNQYKTGCGGLNAGTCQACNPSSCQANHYLAGCGGLSAGTCTACPGCPINQERIGCSKTFSQGSCQPCGSAEYKDTDTNAACQPCPGCPAGQHNSACQTCSPTESGFFSTSTAYGGQIDCLMSATATSCTTGQELSGCGGSSAGSCLNCGSEEFNSVAGGEQCTPCSPACTSDQYESISCTTTTNRECTNCLSCGLGRYRSGCGGTSTGSCQDCPADQFNDGSSISGCTACSTCGSGSYESTACNAGGSNRGCSTCTSACGSGFWESTACTATTNRVCTACLLCPPGSTMTGCSGTSAGVCKADQGYSGGDLGGFDATTYNSLNCATPGTCGSYQACSPGTYKPNSGDSPCEPCPTCLENQYLSACHPISGGVCQSCPGGYSSPPGSLQSSDCTLCHESTIENPTSCDNLCQAPAGYVISSDGNNLEKCIEGTYNAGTTGLTCTDCPTGKTSEAGAVAESDCVCTEGHYLLSSTCTACEEGTYKEDIGNQACTGCAASSTTLNSGADDITDCLCLSDYEPDWQGQCQPCSDSSVKHITGDELCITCAANQTLSPDLPHQQSSCLCDEGFTGTHLGCTPCPQGSYKDTKGSTTCISCADHATTPTAASTNISQCACEGPMWLPSQTGPDEVGGTCRAACGPGETAHNYVCIPCSEGTYKSVQGLEACTDCADPRNSSPPGATNAGHCSCPQGKIALGGNFVQIVSVGLGSDTSTIDCGHSSQSCTIDMQPNQRLKSVELTGSGHQHISIITNGMKVFVCTTDCDLFTGKPISLPNINGNTQIMTTSGQLTVSLFNGRAAVFSDAAPWMDEVQARSLILSHRLGPGDFLLDSTSLVLTPNACIECIKGMICKQYITEWVTECPAGKYTETGLKCSNCEAGKSSPAGSQYITDCVSCPAGKSAGVGQECSQCPAGKFADSGQVCSNCAEGKSSPAGSLYSSDCVNCTAGQSAAAGQACSTCPAGKYAEAGQVCSNCTAGMSSPAGSQYSSDCVNCVAGKYSLAGNCTDCTDNSKSADGADSCTSCALGEVFYIQHENRDRSYGHFNFFQAGQKLTRGPDHQYGAYYTISPQLYFANQWINVFMYQTDPLYCWDYWDEYFGTLQECAFILSPGYPTRYAGFGTVTDVTSEVFLQEWNSYINGDVRDECRDKKIY